jgi:hypothetical protein
MLVAGDRPLLEAKNAKARRGPDALPGTVGAAPLVWDPSRAARPEGGCLGDNDDALAARHARVRHRLADLVAPQGHRDVPTIRT